MIFLSFAKVLRARKLFWISDAMLVGSLCGLLPKSRVLSGRKEIWPIHTRSLLRGSCVVPALVTRVDRGARILVGYAWTNCANRGCV